MDVWGDLSRRAVACFNTAKDIRRSIMIIAVIIIYLTIGFFDALQVMGKPTFYQPLIALNTPSLYILLSLFFWPFFMKKRNLKNKCLYDGSDSEPLVENYYDHYCRVCNSQDSLYLYTTSYGEKVVICLNHEYVRETMSQEKFDSCLKLIQRAEYLDGKNDKEYVRCVTKIVKVKGFEDYWCNYVLWDHTYAASLKEVLAEE
jgi:hypothetical protein